MNLRPFASAICAAAPLFAIAAHAVAAQTAAQPAINLAFAIPKPTSLSPLGGSHLSSSARIGTDIGVVALGAAIATDDRGIYRTVQGPHGPSPKLDSDVNVITDLGNPAYIGPVLGALYLTGGSGNRNIARLSAIAVVRAGLVGVVLKELVGRERPTGPQGGSADTFHPLGPVKAHYESFPSGHTLTAFAVGTVWAAERPSERYLAYGLATAVGLSRIVKGAHWPSDVFFGALLGFTQARGAVHGNVNVLDIRF